jgi:hypothetical protein
MASGQRVSFLRDETGTVAYIFAGLRLGVRVS